MALVLADRVKDTTTTTGTGTITLSGTAPTGYQTFGTAIGNGNTTYYTIANSTEWEVGLGTYTAAGTTLSRTTVLSSSNAGALVNFSAGTKDVFVTYPAGKSIYRDSTGVLDAPGQGSFVTDNSGTYGVRVKARASDDIYSILAFTNNAGASTYTRIYAGSSPSPYQAFEANGSEYMRGDGATGNVGIGTSGAPSSLAKLEVASTTSGFLPPRMTTTQRDNISGPPNGLIIYNSTTDKLQVRAAGVWVDLH